MRRALLAGLLVVAAIAVFVATRGEDEGCGDGYPETPRCVAEAFVTRDGASKCDLVEQAALEAVMRVRGPEARERCEQMADDSPAPKKIEFLEEEGEGEEGESEEGEGSEEGAEDGEATEEGTAKVEFLVDGKENSLTLRRIDGRWRIVSFEE